MIDKIPLSWLRCDVPNPGLEYVMLPLSGLRWIHTAEIPNRMSFENVYREIADKLGGFVAIRGCRGEIAQFLIDKGFGALRTGAEAVMDLDEFREPSASLRSLVRRGLRHGGIEEIPFSEWHERRVSRFKSLSAHGSKPQLQYLFNSEFRPETRCFVFKVPSTTDRWLGAVTVSMSSRSGAHTEMILRDRNAPPGVMEALLVGVMNKLKGEGFNLFSLGEVPFVSPAGAGTAPAALRSRIMGILLFGAGRALRYAYDYESLYRFKNKFGPRWEPVYLCAPGISWRVLADIFFVSRFYVLSWRGMISTIKNFSPWSLKHS
ncbi:MAG TPA: phosphatidylglycerol lysyltransferase domain-containing protein [Thermodesulfobacteriota bacterium]|nr:phosphatidylglycerol lysyltransferase domain-containing protein [Thermodesulfobacteriota bacterium]